MPDALCRQQQPRHGGPSAARKRTPRIFPQVHELRSRAHVFVPIERWHACRRQRMSYTNHVVLEQLGFSYHK
eukprot:4608038-Amphidinium_carterae.1